jgi:TetR/AcrR family transcriptional regulator of autoinduction and epiphytic fitness
MAKRDENRDQQRERILDAARSLFAVRGFDSVTMAEVSEVAGVARATVFNHFGSKVALVEALTENVFAYWAAMLSGALADEKTATPALVRNLFDHMGFGIEQFQGFHRGVFREIMKIQVGLEEGGAAARTAERAFALLQQLLARGQQRGELARDFTPIELASAFDSLSVGTINRWLYDDTSGPLRDRMVRAAEIFLRAAAARRRNANRARATTPERRARKGGTR